MKERLPKIEKKTISVHFGEAEYKQVFNAVSALALQGYMTSMSAYIRQAALSAAAAAAIAQEGER